MGADVVALLRRSFGVEDLMSDGRKPAGSLCAGKIMIMSLSLPARYRRGLQTQNEVS